MKIRDIGLFAIGSVLISGTLARLIDGLLLPMPLEVFIACDVALLIAGVVCVIGSFKDPV